MQCTILAEKWNEFHMNSRGFRLIGELAIEHEWLGKSPMDRAFASNFKQSGALGFTQTTVEVDGSGDAFAQHAVDFDPVMAKTDRYAGQRPFLAFGVHAQGH